MDTDKEVRTEETPRVDSKPPRKWARKLWGALPPLVLIAVIAVLVFGMLDRIKTKNERLKAEKAEAMKTERPEINVVALELQSTSISDRMSLPGTVTPFIQLDVLTEVRGQIVKKHVTEGAQVKRGDLLVTMDSKDYRLQQASTQASYDAALANQKRLTRLYKNKLATRAQLDDTTAQVDSLKAALDTAKHNVARCTIEAPQSGIVNALPVETGQYLNIADPVATVIQVDKVKVLVGIPESDIDAVRNLEEFEVIVDALAGRKFSGKRHFLSKTADEMARLYRLEIAVDNSGGELLPDMFTRVNIVKRCIENAAAIPLFAVINRDEKHYAYVVNDEHAHLRPIELGILEGWRIEVVSGLNMGEKVIVVGQRSVSEGTPVNVVRTVADAGEINP
jgi:RND family efflux transporter MFP subunit